MKRMIALVLSVLLLFGCVGCGQGASRDLKDPVTFYYLADPELDSSFDSSFVTEIHEGSSYSQDRISLLNFYFRGPYAEGAVSPFPKQLRVITIDQPGKAVQILLNDEITTLTGLDLTLACACLSQTVFDLYDCRAVEIRSESGQIDGKEFIRIEAENMIFRDSVYTDVET